MKTVVINGKRMVVSGEHGKPGTPMHVAVLVPGRDAALKRRSFLKALMVPWIMVSACAERTGR